MSKPKQHRIVQYAFYDQTRSKYGRRNNQRRLPYPVIRIGGRFMEHLGFNIGEPVAVEYEAGKITITKLTREEGEPKPPICFSTGNLTTDDCTTKAS